MACEKGLPEDDEGAISKSQKLVKNDEKSCLAKMERVIQQVAFTCTQLPGLVAR